MNKLALLAATLVAFAGCSRNDTGDMSSTPDRSGTASGSAASRQTGSDSMADRSTPPATSPSTADTNQPTPPSQQSAAPAQQPPVQQQQSQPANP